MNNPEIILNQANQESIKYVDSAVIYMQQHEWLAAEQGFKLALELDPTNKVSLLGLAQIAHNNGHSANEYIDILMEHYSDEPHIIMAAATIREDGELLKTAYIMNPQDIEIGLVYANYLSDNFRTEEAGAILKSLSPGDNLEIKLTICNGLVDCSEIKTAIKYLKEILIERPLSWVALCHSLNIFKHADLDNLSEDNIREVITNISTPVSRISLLNNGLGKLLEHRTNYKESWAAYTACNDLVKKERNNYPKYKETLTRYKKTFTKEFFSDLPPASDNPMIFVFGMPRSGTTLIEQILGSHSDITALGELQAASQTTSEFAKIWESGNGTIPDNPDDIAKNYMEKRVREFDTKFAVDKMPGNFKFIPILYLMFPKAKFIYCKRDALDNCFSCLTTLFGIRHDYSFDQIEMGKEYNFHLDLMELWNEVLPTGLIHQVNYEDMVNSQEDTTKSLLNYIGVDYEEECQDFYKLKRNVRTASLAQVVKPVYKTSISRAEPYKQYLSELIGELNVRT